MNTVRTLALVLTVPLLASSAGLTGCEKKSEAPARPAAKGDGQESIFKSRCWQWLG